MRIKGYHGTSISSAKEIIKSNYDLSIGDKEWLGNGVYFFIEGISSKPNEQAKNWAITQSWDNIKQEHKYKEYCVIKSNFDVNEDNLLDLTKEEGVEILAYFLECFEEKIKKLNKNFDFIDGLLINLARGEGILPIDVVKGNFYIKFAKERKKRINLRTPNCTICTVFKPNENIVDSTIIITGDIKDETK
ncbi:hypothetical protein J2Q11_02775 [Tenacibaculum finnmarkense genomovar finnmarkense]|uniref:DUF3990 domain-containing protein n=2 Tax=Tenacibaculum finnmarkense TaxID=2781243 RepID=A0A2I2MA62_9FLAO|nr:hypothetical protein [Tenacibaculum finnmarkense]MBE7644696.1 hypothetical protein [Tenacibaculum finnmarkense genomovar ulcerans]MBE7646861.1 hypothetical protein [Tenacibaculum finnmarkense genomovar ulcerans]MBE7651906.1 hypothetical protein [Tenacibaculum finnmarkense genomovar finnmarkense]MBE7659132.1 hypothetical protein [Tenacibaculum finnmarkense genomovar finnmarkense]MBE7686637.1 hypothetical protein [Tenacibaculum finnmarkense genomovar ulcerans]